MKAYLESEDVKKLIAAAQCTRDRLLILLLFYLGCRISEALAIVVENIDFQNGTITIQHLKTRLQISCPTCNTRLSRQDVFCPGCGIEVANVVTEARDHHRQRILPLGRELAVSLEDYIKRGGPVDRDGRRLLFGINRHRAWQIVKECGKKAQLLQLTNPETGRVHHVSPHKLRDAFAVHAVKVNDTGDGLRMLQEHLGHASFNTTAKYRKVSGEEHREWYTKLWEKTNDGRTP